MINGSRMINDYELGYYKVNDLTFTNKAQAVLAADQLNASITWNFFDDIWTQWIESYRSTLGHISLDELYKQRALQIRDQYDYLILNYSGGSDSHNILMTFLKNNIKLDEIYVRYSTTVDQKIYRPNILDTSSSNIFSEYDFCIKPTLEYVARYYPQIKITVGDMFQGVTPDIVDDDLFLKTHHHMGAFFTLRIAAESNNILRLTNQGQRVGVMIGVDKPHCIISDNKFYMYFMDAALVPAVSLNDKTHNTELFYWSIDFPQLAFEQAWQCYQWIKTNIKHHNKIDINQWKHLHGIDRETQFLDNLLWFNDVCKEIIYTTWDYRFQTDKGRLYLPAGLDKDKFYLDHSELNAFVDRFNYQHQGLIQGIHNQDLLTSAKTFRACMSKFYYIGNLE